MLYLIICIVAIELLRSLKNKIEGNITKLHVSLHHSPRGTNMEIHLRTWRRQYFYLVQLVDFINECFSCSLLITTISIFLLILNGIFFSTILFILNLHFESITNFYHVIRYFMYFSIIAYLPTKMKSEVSKLNS